MIRVVSFDIGGTLIKSSKEHSVLQKISEISDVSLDVLKNEYYYRKLLPKSKN